MDAAIYARISLDATGEGLGVERQIDDCKRKAKSLGWAVVDTYVDNDVSASKSKPRPQYQRLMADFEAGRVEALVVYDLDRLTRKPAELESFIDLAEKKSISLANVSGDVDLTTASGRMVARIKGAVARQEAERLGERVKRQKQQRAEQGLPQGGRERLYGYTRDWEVIESEAEIVREAFKRRASGESTTSIARDFEARGLKTAAGRPWRSGSLWSTLRKPGYAGLREFKGEIIGKTSYPAIIDESTFNVVNSNLLADRKGTNARKHLLSGFLVCSKCLSPMKGNSNSASYRCSTSYGGCGSTSMKIGWCDDAVIEAAMRKHLETREPSEGTGQDRDYDGELKAVDARISEAREEFSAGDLPMADLMPLLKSLRARKAEISEAQAEDTRRHQFAPHIQARAEFQAMNLSQQRAFIDSVVVNVVVDPPKHRGRQKMDASRLEVHYQDGTVERLGAMVYTVVEVDPETGQHWEAYYEVQSE